MEPQKIFKESYVDTLRRNVKDGSFVKYYESDTFLIDTDKVLLSPSIIKHKEFKFIIPNKNTSEFNEIEFENAKMIYEAYKSLTPLQASDVRFWTYLAHDDLFEYMSKRWPDIRLKQTNKQSEYILKHWFISSPAQSNFLRHGIAGLWWAAHLTYDETRKNPYELTKILYRQLDFATRTLGTYYLARHKEAVYGILEFIMQNPDLFQNKFEAKTRFLTKYINQVGGTKPLSYFKRDFFISTLEFAKDRLALVI